MLSRLFLILITLFFLTMNVLLWRYEISGRGKLGSPVPVKMVWQKMLAAPDNSALEIRHQGRRIGYCRWAPQVGEEIPSGQVLSDQLPPEGMVRAISNYRVDFDGGLFLEGMGHVRFNCHLELATNQVWERFYLRLTMRPTVYELEALAKEEVIRLRVEEKGAVTDRTFRFDEFREPERLAEHLGGPVVLELLKTTGLAWPKNPAEPPPAWLGLKWEAREDILPMGRVRLQVYRIQTRLFDRFQVAVTVSRVGEILQVELPGQTLLVNDAFLHL